MIISEDKSKILNSLEKQTTVIIQGEAGTGKTLIGVLAGQKLLEGSKNWENVLYLTYSKLAKRQINKTIHRLLDEKLLNTEILKKMEVLNYHSLWWKLIMNYYGFLGISKKPMICTPNELKLFKNEMAYKVPKEIVPDYFLTRSRAFDKKKKDGFLKSLSGTCALYAQFGAEHFGRNADKFIGHYEFLEWSKNKIFERNRVGLFSHDETVCWAYRLLNEHPNILNLLREKYSIFIIDEFQDTDVAQWEIIKLIKPKTLIVFADSAQTIHHWRGADPKRICQLKNYCEVCGVYKKTKVEKLFIKHRTSRNMSDPKNIEWIEEREEFNPKNSGDFNKIKRYLKVKCKTIAMGLLEKKQNVAVMCLTNLISDDVTLFFRQKQELKNGTLPNLKCARFGANYSPFEQTRELILNILHKVENEDDKGLQEYLSNGIFEALFFNELEKCSKRSHKEYLKEQWNESIALRELFLEDFGEALFKLGKFIVKIEKREEFYSDILSFWTLRRVVEALKRVGKKVWESFSIEEKRNKIESIILQYENAISGYRKDNLSIMTIHQAKAQEFDNVIIFWFSTIPWDKSEGIKWDMRDKEHINLFHTACTRAKNNVYVISPSGYSPSWPPHKIN